MAGSSFPCAGGRGAPAAGWHGAALLYPSANGAGVSPEGGEVCSAAGEAPALAGRRPRHFEFWGRFLCKVLHAELGPGRVIREGCFALLKAQLAMFNSM